MGILFAHGGRGKPLGPNECLLLGLVFGVIAAWFMLCLVNPSFRQRMKVGRHGGGGPPSALFCFAWMSFPAAWNLTLLGAGLRNVRLLALAPWLVGGGTLVLIGALF